MIQANALMIGNWVDIDGNFTRVNHIMGDEDYFEPIPLRPEILVKCGFEENIVFEGINTGVYKLCKFEVGLDGSDFVNREMTVIIEESLALKMKYLHQLQNLYFALTDEELEFKP